MIKTILDFFVKPKVEAPKDAWDAYRKGFNLSDNPYPRHTPDHSIWRDDFLFASGKTRL